MLGYNKNYMIFKNQYIDELQYPRTAIQKSDCVNSYYKFIPVRTAVNSVRGIVEEECPYEEPTHFRFGVFRTRNDRYHEYQLRAHKYLYTYVMTENMQENLIGREVYKRNEKITKNLGPTEYFNRMAMTNPFAYRNDLGFYQVDDDQHIPSKLLPMNAGYSSYFDLDPNTRYKMVMRVEVPEDFRRGVDCFL